MCKEALKSNAKTEPKSLNKLHKEKGKGAQSPAGIKDPESRTLHP